MDAHHLWRSERLSFFLIQLLDDKMKDYRFYLRMWAKEKEQKKESIKDLPRINQEQFIEFCKTLYNLFAEQPEEQQLYHSIATVASLLLRIGEVGKKFNNSAAAAQTPSSTQTPHCNPADGASGESDLCQALDNAQLESVTLPLCDEDTKDDSSASSYSVVSSGSLACEDIAEEQRRGSVLDLDWSITFEQVLASLLTEPPLVDYFERKHDIQTKIAACKTQRAVERQISSSSEHEISPHSVWLTWQAERSSGLR